MSKWPTAKLCDVCEINPRFRGTLSHSQIVSFVPMAAVSETTGAIEKQHERTFGEVSKGFTPFQRGDVIIAKITPCFENGKIALAETPHVYAFGSTEFHVARPGIQLDRRYLFHFLRRPEIRIEGTKNMTGSAGQRRVPRQFFEALEIPLPPLDEQRQIAAILDKADALRQKRRQAIAKLDQLVQATFLEMFLGAEMDSWPTVKIADLIEARSNSMRTGPFGSQLLHSEFVDSGIAVLGIDNVVQNRFLWGKPRFITEEKYKELQRYRVYPRDVLVTIMGTCGRCAVVPDEIPVAINTKHLCAMTLDQKKCLPIFLHTAFLRHPIILQQLKDSTRGAIMDGLNMGTIKSLVFPLPPIDLQVRFVEFMNKVSASVEKNDQGLLQNDALFASLQQSLFSEES